MLLQVSPLKLLARLAQRDIQRKRHGARGATLLRRR
jgi:hypothetical protein